MRIFLQFLSNVVILLMMSGFDAVASCAEPVPAREQGVRYRFGIETTGGFVSGIMIAHEDDEYINASMINEFGVSAIDFSYSKRKDKVKLLNVVSFLDKWYIRHVLKNDLKYCVKVLYALPQGGKQAYEVVRDDDNLTINNGKRHIRYSFSPLSVTANEDETEE